MRIVDLSRELYHRTPSYPGQPPIIHGIWKTHDEARAESGGVPVSAASPAIYVSQIEVQKKAKSQERIPILPAPKCS